MTEDALLTAAQVSKAWPFEEARKVLKRYSSPKANGPVIFETGYGPSGLPHIGTFNEVLRTTMVRRAFEALTDMPTQLIAFSDDMDGLRKVPDNVPNQAMLAEHLGKPLSRIPDPFEKFESFAHHNNAMLREFLDRFGFDYDFISSTTRYEGGHFDEALRNVLRCNQAILDIMLPTLRKERAATYSPILPISEKSGIVLQVPVEVVDAEAGLVRFEDGGEMVTQSVLGGKAKLQWKVDWAMRWVALGVDYEMSGKDLIDSVKFSSKVARAIAKSNGIPETRGVASSTLPSTTVARPASSGSVPIAVRRNATRLRGDTSPERKKLSSVAMASSWIWSIGSAMSAAIGTIASACRDSRETAWCSSETRPGTSTRSRARASVGSR